MTNDKELKHLLSRINRLTTLKNIEESIDLMKDLVIDNDEIPSDFKKQYIFVYIQCQQFLSLYRLKNTKIRRRYAIKNKLLSLMRSKKK